MKSRLLSGPVPMALLGIVTALVLRGFPVDLYTQIGLVLMIALAAMLLGRILDNLLRKKTGDGEYSPGEWKEP